MRRKNLIGFFVNTLVMRTEVRAEQTVGELLEGVRETTLGAYTHQDVPFEKLVEMLAPERDLSRTPLFQVMFILQNAPMPELELGAARLEPLGVETETAKFEMTLSLEEEAESGEIGGYLEYNRELFKAETIGRMIGHYERLAEAVTEGIEERVGELEMLGEGERKRIIGDWNETEREYRAKCLHELFEEQAARTPEAVAVSGKDGRLTYGELNRKANQLARYLRRRGEGLGSRVGISIPRSTAMVTAILGVLKAGPPMFRLIRIILLTVCAIWLRRHVWNQFS